MQPDLYYRKAKVSMRRMDFRGDIGRWRDNSTFCH